nr:MAG TPA: Alternative WD40 repeat motif [Caudoviricetes sp.]
MRLKIIKNKLNKLNKSVYKFCINMVKYNRVVKYTSFEEKG